MLIKVILTGHITHKVAILLFHGGDLFSLITFEWTILYEAVSCFRFLVEKSYDYYLKGLRIYILKM